MKRDWELIRKILFRLEEIDAPPQVLRPNAIDRYDAHIVSYHIYLMNGAGLIEATCHRPTNGSMTCFATTLTWEGHEFLDKIRSDTAWNRTKSLIREKGLDLSFDAIKQAAVAVVKAAIT